MKKITLLLLLFYCTTAYSQSTDKRLLTWEDIEKWNRIRNTVVSENGEVIAYQLVPWKGDNILKITTKSGDEKQSIIGGGKAKITKGSDFVVFKISPMKDTVRALKLKKTKKDKMPKSELGIYNVAANSLEKIARIKSYKLPSKLDGWIAYQTTPEKKKKEKKEKKESKEQTPADSTNAEKKIKKENKDNGYKLVVRNLKQNSFDTIPYVTSFSFAKEAEKLAFVTTGDDEDLKAGLYVLDLKKKEQTLLLQAEGSFKQISFKKDGSKLAFLHDTSDKKATNKDYSLYLWNGKAEANMIINNQSKGLDKDWIISDNRGISFTDKNDRLFFGTMPKLPEKDTTILDEEIPEVDVWHYNEPELQTVQIVNKNKTLKRAYLAVYHYDKPSITQLETPEFDYITLIDEGKSNFALAFSTIPYGVLNMWEPWPSHKDVYLIDIFTGKKKQIIKDSRAFPHPSPEGKYIYWYNPMDTTWNTYNIKTTNYYKVSTPDVVQVSDELNDIPNPPSSYAGMGWLKNDKAIIVYDRYDIWKLDPENKQKPVRITTNGRETKNQYREIAFNNQEDWLKEGIDPKKDVFIESHNEISRADAYYKISLNKPSNPKPLIEGKFHMTSRPIKAKEADVVVFSIEDFETYPDLLVSDLSFKNYKQISDAAPQQKEFHWGTAELFTWTSLDGRKLEGTLHKPENFDPNKKYPLIVNFYEKNSQKLYLYRMPENHRSTVDYHYYTSNGYIVFNPDVYYKTGYPGEDAFNCVMPGITKLIAEGYIDEKAIGAQGHSWGGYQVAYMATRTNLFAAIESGAPVVNMISAYGGIRWNTGLNRSFQYEHTQSRIGKNIWESPLRYIENSPVFTLDKINTPILIMANDDDGYVPWWQGIEFFIGLRRLEKPSWLLNYNDADHWPMKHKDKYDFQVRLQQFFDHYLKGKPMPQWMKEGIPAVKKGYEMGYELVED